MFRIRSEWEPRLLLFLATFFLTVWVCYSLFHLLTYISFPSFRLDRSGSYANISFICIILQSTDTQNENRWRSLIHTYCCCCLLPTVMCATGQHVIDNWLMRSQSSNTYMGYTHAVDKRKYNCFTKCLLNIITWSHEWLISMYHSRVAWETHFLVAQKLSRYRANTNLVLHTILLNNWLCYKKSYKIKCSLSAGNWLIRWLW